MASSARTVRAVWENYGALHSHFIQASQDIKRESKERSKYTGLAKRLSAEIFLLSLGLMFDALQELSELSLRLQNRNIEIFTAHHEIVRQC